MSDIDDGWSVGGMYRDHRMWTGPRVDHTFAHIQAAIDRRDARIAELESQVTALCDAREQVAMMVPVGVDTGTVEKNVERYIGQLVHDVERWRDLAQVEADTLTQTERRIWAMVRERNEARAVLAEFVAWMDAIDAAGAARELVYLPAGVEARARAIVGGV